MKPYKGIVKISCKRKDTCLKKLTGNVEPACLDCLEALIEIESLDGKVLAKARPKLLLPVKNKSVKAPKQKEG